MLSKSPEDVLIREADGTLKDAATRAHVFILSRSAFRSLQNTLYDKFTDAASLILYDMGEGYGGKLASGLLKRGLSLEETIKEVERLGYLAGWGREHFRILENAHAECVVKNSMFSLERKGLANSCFFLAGVFGGIWSAMHNNQQFFAKELECTVSGYDHCRFAIEERKLPNR